MSGLAETRLARAALRWPCSARFKVEAVAQRLERPDFRSGRSRVQLPLASPRPVVGHWTLNPAFVGSNPTPRIQTRTWFWTSPEDHGKPAVGSGGLARLPEASAEGGRSGRQHCRRFALSRIPPRGCSRSSGPGAALRLRSSSSERAGVRSPGERLQPLGSSESPRRGCGNRRPATHMRALAFLVGPEIRIRTTSV